MDIIQRNAMAHQNNVDSFQKCFKVSLSQFWDGNVTGFNVIKFDKWLKTPEEKSMQDVIIEKYNVDGLKIVKSLLGMK